MFEDVLQQWFCESRKGTSSVRFLLKIIPHNNYNGYYLKISSLNSKITDEHILSNFLYRLKCFALKHIEIEKYSLEFNSTLFEKMLEFELISN